jgi:hypothetical protein
MKDILCKCKEGDTTLLSSVKYQGKGESLGSGTVYVTSLYEDVAVPVCKSF